MAEGWGQTEAPSSFSEVPPTPMPWPEWFPAQAQGSAQCRDGVEESSLNPLGSPWQHSLVFS